MGGKDDATRACRDSYVTCPNGAKAVSTRLARKYMHEKSTDRGVWRGSGRDEIVQAQYRRSGAGLPVMRTKPCASARGLVAAPVKWPGSESLGVVLKAAT